MNAPMDLLTEALRDAEDALNGLKLGVSAEVSLDEGCALVWAKSGAQWMLQLRLANGDTGPLLKASKRARIVAAGHLRTLLEAMHAASDAEAIEIRGAILAAQSFASECRSAQCMSAGSKSDGQDQPKAEVEGKFYRCLNCTAPAYPGSPSATGMCVVCSRAFTEGVLHERQRASKGADSSEQTADLRVEVQQLKARCLTELISLDRAATQNWTHERRGVWSTVERELDRILRVTTASNEEEGKATEGKAT